MDDWIRSLWEELATSPLGSVQLLGAVWDLACLADAGLVDLQAFDAALENLEDRDLEDEELAYWKDLAGDLHQLQDFPKQYSSTSDYVLGDFTQSWLGQPAIEFPLGYDDRSHKGHKRCAIKTV